MIVKNGILKQMTQSGRATEFEVVSIEGNGWKEEFVAVKNGIRSIDVYNGNAFEENYEIILDNTSGPYTYEWTVPMTQVDSIGGSGISILDCYPRGSVYTTADASFDPNIAWGGKWQASVVGGKKQWLRTA